MNYIKEAENVLWYYNNIFNSLENLDRQINALIRSQGPKDITAVSLDQTGVRSGRVDNTENMLYALKVLRDCKNESLLALDEADKLLQQISVERGCESYGRVLRLWYIEKWHKDDIATEIGYAHKKDVYRIKERAIEKFAVNYFGIKALNVV